MLHYIKEAFKMQIIYQGNRIEDEKPIKGNYFYDAYKNKHYIFPERTEYVTKFEPSIYEVEQKSVGIYLGRNDIKGNMLFDKDKVIVNVRNRTTEVTKSIEAEIRFNDKYLLFYLYPLGNKSSTILFKGDAVYEILSIEKIL